MDNEILDENTSLKSAPEEYVMTVEEAEEITQSIKSAATATYILLQRAHEEKAWKALGYDTWANYVEEEFKFSRARSYQILSQANVIREISESADVELYLTEKEAKILKKELPKITEKIKNETEGLSDEDRLKQANGILKEEIQHQMATDKDTYDESKDIDAMLAEDNDSDESYSGNNFTDGDYKKGADKWGPTEENTISEVEEANFYIQNLGSTLSIFEALPKASSLTSLMDSSEEEKIQMRNKVKYAISWLKEFENSLE